MKSHQISLSFLLLFTLLCRSLTVYPDVYYVNAGPNTFTTPKAHIWNSSTSAALYTWNNALEAMTLTDNTSTDGIAIYSYAYNSGYDRVIIHDNGSDVAKSGDLNYYDGMYYYRYSNWVKACASTNVEINIGISGDDDSWGRHDLSAGLGYTLLVKLDLDASTTYDFKLHHKQEGESGGWWGNSGTMTSTNCTNWNMTDGANNCKITTTTAGTYTFCYDYSTDQLSVLYPGVNIAQGKASKSGWSRTETCSDQNANEIPGKANDGDTSTKWVSWGCNDATKAWWAVDLRRAYWLNSFATVWNWDAEYTPAHYLIQVMTDTPSDFTNDVSMSDEDWVTVMEVNESQTVGTSDNSYAFGVVSARYVRLVSLDKNVIGLSEFKIYADAFASEPVVTPTMGEADVYSDLSSGSATLTLTATDHSEAGLHTFLLQDQTGKYFRAVTDASDQCTISGLENKRYVFTVWAIENGYKSANSAQVIVGASTFSTSTNLALNKPAYAVRYQGSSTNTPDKANDGTLDNFWNAGSDEGQAIAEADRDDVWWYVDLQDQYELKSLALFWEGAYANSFIMQVRKDAPTLAQAGNDSAWETFLDYSGDQTAGTTESGINLYGDITGSKAAFSVTPKGRYVRFRAKGAADWAWGVKLREVRIYGSRYLPIDDEAPVMSAASYNGVTADFAGVKFDVTTSDNMTDPVTDYLVIDEASNLHYVTADDGVITVSGLATGRNQTVTIYAFDDSRNKSAAREVVFDYVNPSDNLALDQTSYACVDIDNGTEGRAQANDGSTTSYWTSYNYETTTNEWWYVDLGDFYDIRRIEVLWMEDYASASYSVQYRQNAPKNDSGATAEEWDAISEFTNVTTGNKSADMGSSIGARYICMRSSAHGTTHSEQNRLAELRVFGNRYGTPDNTDPEWTTGECDVTGATESTITMKLEATDANPANIYEFVITIDNGTTTKDYERSTTAQSNVITITDAEFIFACQSYDITATCSDHVGNEATRTFSDVVPSLSAETNILSDASATVDAGTASAALDANTGTRWISGNSDTDVSHWINVDIGAVRNVSTLKIAWETACPKDYYIEGSVDGTNYYPLLHETTAPTKAAGSFNGYDEYTFADEIGARYLKVRSVTNNTGYGLSIWEMQAYGACYEELEKPVTTFSRLVSQEANGDNSAVDVTLEVGAYDNETTFANMRYKISYVAEGGSPTVLDNQTASSGILTIEDLAFSTDYTVTITARDAADGNLADNSKQVAFRTQDKQSTLYFRNSMNWQDGGLSQDYRFAYVSAGSDVMYFNVVPNTDDLQYRLFDDTDNDEQIDNPGDTWSTAGNQHLHDRSGETVTFYAKDQDHFVSTADLVYVVGSAVKATEATAWQMTQIGTTYFWEGQVTAGNKYKIIVKAQENESLAASAFTDHSRARIMADSATFTNSEGYTYARIIFDMSTWTCTWTEANFVIYHKDDKADDPRAVSSQAESFAGGSISGTIEYRMKVRAKDRWYALYLPFDVDAVKVWDAEDGDYYDIYPYYRSDGKYIAWHYIIRTPETASNLSLANFGNWNDPTSKAFLPEKNTPYIIQWHDSYFVGRYISFFGHSDTAIPTSMTAGTAPTSDNVVNVCGNNAMVSGTVRDAYLLEGDYGAGAWLREEIGTDRTILPFECYLLAKSTTAVRFAVVRRGMVLDDTPTSVDEVVGNHTVQQTIAVYTLSGCLVQTYSNMSVEQVGQALAERYSEGLFLLRGDKECVKLLMGGK